VSRVVETARVAARLLRVLLSAAVVAMVVGWALADTPVGAAIRTGGVGAIVVAPFAVLLVAAGRHRRDSWYAAGTLALAVVGYLLAR
jgi:hypothetical protein